MTKVSSLFAPYVLFGIICGHLTVAQMRQRRLLPYSTRLQQRVRLTPSGSQTRSLGSRLLGPQHTLFEGRRASSQRLSGSRSRVVDPRQVPRGSNRLRPAGPRRRSRTSIRRPSGIREVTKTPPNIPELLKIFARNLKVINSTSAERPKITNTKTSNLASLTSRGSRTRSPLRIRAKLREISNQGSEGPKVKKSNPSQLKNRVAKDPIEKRIQKDMIAVDDIIALVKAIQGKKEPSSVKTHGRSLNTGGSSGPRGNNGVSSSKKGGKNNGRSTAGGNNKTGQSAGLQTSGTGKKLNRPSLDLMTQMALMNSEGGGFSSLLSDPLFLSQLSTGTGGAKPAESSNSGTVENRKNGGKGKSVNRNTKTNVVIHPSLLKGGNKSEIKIVNTGNPVQDKMISSLLQKTLKNLRDDLHDNLV